MKRNRKSNEKRTREKWNQNNIETGKEYYDEWFEICTFHNTQFAMCYITSECQKKIKNKIS